VLQRKHRERNEEISEITENDPKRIKVTGHNSIKVGGGSVRMKAAWYNKITNGAKNKQVVEIERKK